MIALSHNELLECKVLLEDASHVFPAFNMGKRELLFAYLAVTICLMPTRGLKGDFTRFLEDSVNFCLDQVDIMIDNPFPGKGVGTTQHDLIVTMLYPLQRFDPYHETVVRHLFVYLGFDLIPDRFHGAILKAPFHRARQ